MKNLLDFSEIKELGQDEIDRLKSSNNIDDKLHLSKLLIKGVLPLDDEIILRFLEDESKTLRRVAINLASKSKSEQSLDKLVELIHSDEYYHICGDALLGLNDLKALEYGIPKAAFKVLSGDDQKILLCAK